LPLDPPPVLRPAVPRWHNWFAGVAIAASLLLFCYLVYPLFRPVVQPATSPNAGTIAWGWARPGALPADRDPPIP
jgi:hypothetical protein